MKEQETKVEIKKIEIKIDDIKLSLTMEQAKKLNDALGELFVKHIVHEYKYSGPWYYTPYYGYGYWSGTAAGNCGMITTSGSISTTNLGQATSGCTTSLVCPNVTLTSDTIRLSL